MLTTTLQIETANSFTEGNVFLVCLLDDDGKPRKDMCFLEIHTPGEDVICWDNVNEVVKFLSLTKDAYENMSVKKATEAITNATGELDEVAKRVLISNIDNLAEMYDYGKKYEFF